MAVKYGSLPFDKQIEFFRQKINLPTRSWTDLWEGMHARAFVVAGATKDALLTDLRGAVDRAISEGTTLAQFKKDFLDIAAKNGWTGWKGEDSKQGRAWRARTIYDTNLRTSYAAGRFAQMQALATVRPYWRYRHNDSVVRPRPEHQSWDGLTLPHDDPWWSTHFPPNGWGCKCYIETLSQEDLAGKSPDQAPPLEMETQKVGTQGPSPRTVRTPKGIDPGFGYNVGEAAWGRALSDQAMTQWREAGSDAWRPLDSRSYLTYQRPDTLPKDEPQAKTIAPLSSASAMAAQLRKLLGAEEKVFNMKGLPVLVNAESLAQHVPPDRSAYLPLIEETIRDPYEVWLSFEQHAASGQVALRSRAVKMFDLGRGRALLFVLQSNKGMLEAWTAIPTSDLKYLNRQRRGWMYYGRK